MWGIMKKDHIFEIIFFATANYINNEEKIPGTQYYICQ